MPSSFNKEVEPSSSRNLQQQCQQKCEMFDNCKNEMKLRTGERKGSRGGAWEVL
jgi:hypothetical protein